MSAKKKRQHYVPRFLLKNFSADKKQIAMVVLATGLRVDGAQLKTQCYRDYFYGKDDILENIFAKLEGEIASIPGDVSIATLEKLDDGQRDKLRMFLHYQSQRTAAAAAAFSGMGEVMAMAIMTEG